MYQFKDLVEIYRRIDPGPARVISIKTDLMALGRYEKSNKETILSDHVAALDKVFDLSRTTIVVATSTTYLCDTSIPYDPVSSRCDTGAFSEYLRCISGAERSFHAFESYAALGKDAALLCKDISPVSYGHNSPESRLVDLEATCIVIGADPIRCCSTIHHLENSVGVPYRYIRSYTQPVIVDNETKFYTFYRNPWYRNSDIKKDTVRFFEKLYAQSFTIDKYPVGAGYISSYKLAEVFHKGSRVLQKDPYLCLRTTPKIQPWTK